MLRPSTFVEFLGHITPCPCSMLPPSPETMLDLSARIASIVFNIGKGEKGWFSIIFSARDWM